MKAVKENLDALFGDGIIDHAIELIRGGSGEELHSVLAEQGPVGLKSASGHHDHDHKHRHGHGHGHGHEDHHKKGHEHNHHHGPGHNHEDHPHQAPQPRSTEALSHDPSAPASARHRKSPYPLISLEQALGIIQEKIVQLEVLNLKVCIFFLVFAEEREILILDSARWPLR